MNYKIHTVSLIITSFIFLLNVQAQERIWKNDGKDNEAVHSLGNGKMCVYEQGPEIITMYPSPFSTPPLFKLLMADDIPAESRSVREYGTAIWTHEMKLEGKQAGTIQDFVDSELPVLVRQMNIRNELDFHLVLNPAALVVREYQDEDGGKGEMLLVMNAGTTIYQKYVYPRPLYHLISWEGPVSMEKLEGTGNEYILSCRPGKITFFFSGGPEYAQAIENMEEARRITQIKLAGRTREWWVEFTKKRKDFEKELPEALPLRRELLQTIDDVSVMIRTQQAEQGAVMAGYPYPLGYVRDQYGVSRGLLALGYHEEARDIMNFYRDVWEKTGELHCAQGIGVDGIFHIHENDEVESPGYLIMQAFDLLEKTGDDEFLRRIFPMLEWCWEVQKKHLAGHMLPFNGDETYVAGGILPRSTLNDGSAEATMLFIDGGEKLLKWISKKNIWPAERLESDSNLLAEVKSHFRKNFWKDGSLITNNPARLNYTDPPRFRHGVCERGGPNCLVYRTDGFGGIDWTEKDVNNRYQCPACLSQGPLPPAEQKIYKLISVSLTPLYFNSGLIENEELQSLVKKIYKNYKRTGVVASRTEQSSVGVNNRTVGYDYGLILYAMMMTGMEEAEDLYRKTLSVVDQTGAWSEYYVNDIPGGTRCRPWESAINMEALIGFALQYPDP